MRRLIFICFFNIFISIFSNEIEGYSPNNFYSSGGKNAIIMAHFGTTHIDTRAKTIDLINSKVKDSFKKSDVFEAYTSRIVINRIKKKEGITKLTLPQLLQNLKKQGYKNIIIQPTTIIDGVEMEALSREAQKFSKQFSDIRVGFPLLSTPKNYQKVVEALDRVGGDLKPNQAIVSVGHGSYDFSTSAYAMLDYVAKDMDKSIYIGTVEGYPSFENIVKQLKKDGKKEVILTPLMFVAGDHAKNDISNDWKERLEKAGFSVKVNLTPLGELSEIQNIYIENIKFLENYKKDDILKKKAKYMKNKNI